jgi:LCP family protein required for cell wall assembly
MVRTRFQTRFTRRAFSLAGAAMGGAAALGLGSTLFAGQTIPATLEKKDSYTFLVGGLDTRTVEEPENTDVIQIARVEIANQRVRTISLPRDLQVEIPGYGRDKINRAYDHGSKANNSDWNAGAALFEEMIEYNFGLEIDAVVTTNLHTMPGIVDALGGVTVVNPYDLSDDAYPTPDYSTKEIFYPAGELTLNGEQALEFSRTRHMDGDDGRVMRQQLVLTAMLESAQRPENLAHLSAIAEAGREFVSTNIPLDIQAQLVSAVPMIPVENLVWGNVIEFLWGATTADGGWNYEADWSYLPVHVRGWLGVGPKAWSGVHLK